jgi:AcrR family transcriptional regulator
MVCKRSLTPEFRGADAVTPATSQRKQQILDHATEFFARFGYAGTSIRAVAAACEITEAAIYRHFDSKLALYEAVIRQKAAQHDIAGYLADRRGQGSVEDLLQAVSAHILAITLDDPALMRLMVNNSFESGEIGHVLFKEVRLPYVTFLSQELEERIAAGEVRAIDPFITSRCFVGMAMDCALHYGVWEKVINSEFVARDVYCNTVPIFARGLLTDAAASAP